MWKNDAEEMPEVLAQTNYDQKEWETEKSWLVSDSMKLNSAESGEAVIDTDWEKAGISAENFDDVMGITSTNMGKRYVTAPFEKSCYSAGYCVPEDESCVKRRRCGMRFPSGEQK